MTNIQSASIQPAREQNVKYLVQTPATEEKNFVEGVMWGVNGVTNLLGGITTGGSVLCLDAFAVIGAASLRSPGMVLVGTVGLTALNVLAYYVVKAEFSIAGKSFKHMSNTIL